VGGFQLCEGDGVAESVLQSCCGLDDRGIGCRFPGGIKDSSPERQDRQRVPLSLYLMGTGVPFAEVKAAEA